jgi:hypothetical protein
MLRKLILTGFVALIIAGFALAGDPPAEHPATGEPLVLEVLRGTPTIDGNLNDWRLDFMIPAVLDTEEQIYPGAAAAAASWDGPEDSSGKFYLMWDDTNIYMAVIMQDDDLIMNKSAGDIWNSDAIEIFFSTTNAIAGCTEHYQYGFNADNQTWNWCNMDGAGQSAIDYLEVASTETDDGYICEAAIEYGQMKSLDIEAGETIGFHPVFDDGDAGGDREMQMTWTGREAHDQSLGFGHITFSMENVAVSPAMKLPTSWGALKQ